MTVMETYQRLNVARLIAQLERLDRFETGFLPALTYGPGRRIGAHGAYVVTVDLATQALTPASGWIGVE